MRIARTAVILASLAQFMRADATLRYHTELQLNNGTSVLSSALQAFRQNQDLSIRIKGNKAYSEAGHLAFIIDMKTQDMTTLDPMNKQYATVPASQYADQAKLVMPAVPEQARAMLAALKTSIESHDTGRTATILGIETEEREIVLTLDMPAAGLPAGSPFMKMILQTWIAKPEEIQRSQVLQELKTYMASATSAMNPAEMVKQIGTLIPGFGDSLSGMIADMTKDGAVTLRTNMQVQMPLLAIMARQMPPLPGQTAQPELDPNAPLMGMSQELVELSGDPVDDAIFQLPADYQSVSLQQILQGAASVPTPPQFKQ
jgi:hypothetical protein